LLDIFRFQVFVVTAGAIVNSDEGADDEKEE